MLVRATPGLSLENSSFAPSIIARLVAHCLPLASFIGSWMPSATAPAIVAAMPKATSISNNVQPALLPNRPFIVFLQAQLCSQFPHKKRADSVRRPDDVFPDEGRTCKPRRSPTLQVKHGVQVTY